MLKFMIIVLAGWLALAGPALAGAFEDGLKAYESKKFKQAAELYRQAAGQGHAVAQLNLGQMYEDGVGVAKDLTAAADWYLKAGEQGNGAAQLKLGEIYAAGLAVDRDLRQSAHWYKKAGEHGDVRAKEALAKVEEELVKEQLEHFLIGEDVARLQGFLAETEKACQGESEEKKIGCAIDRFWQFSDVSGDGKLSLAELSRWVRLLLKVMVHEQKAEMEIEEKLGIVLAGIYAGPLLSVSILHSFDYDNDELISRQEAFADSNFAQMVGLDISRTARVVDVDRVRAKLLGLLMIFNK